MSSKLADWDDDDPQAIQETSSRWDKVVILKHLFTLKELEARPTDSLLYHPCFSDFCTYRKTQQPCSTSRKTSETNASRWAKSPMLFYSTKKVMA